MWKLYRNMPLAGGVGAIIAAVIIMTTVIATAVLRVTPVSAQQRLLGAGLPTVSLSGPCLRSGKAYLQARIRGAIHLDIDFRGSKLACEGGPRFDGSGIRMGFEGRVKPGGRRVRMVFGIGGAKEGRPGRELPTNLTVIFEGERLLFATQGQGNCTVDRLTQEPLGPTRRSPAGAGEKPRSYRIVAHGFCIAPANDLTGRRRILVSTFDFAGRADFDTP